MKAEGAVLFNMGATPAANGEVTALETMVTPY